MENKEQLIKRISEISVVLAFVVGIYLSIVFYDVGLFIMLAGFSLLAFLLIEFYLRIQHNIDRSVYSLKKMFEKEKTIEERAIHEEITYSLENMISYLEDFKKEICSNLESIKMQAQMQQANFSKDSQIEELKEYQRKIVALLEQLMQYQKEQANFIAGRVEEIEK